MMVQDRPDGTRVTISYGSSINQLPTDTIKSVLLLERTYTEIRRQKMSILVNEIIITEEMLPKYTHACPSLSLSLYIYIYIYNSLNIFPVNVIIYLISFSLFEY